MPGNSLSFASLDMAAEMLAYASFSRVMTHGDPKAQPVINSTRFAAISEVACESKQRSTKPKTPYERTKRFIVRTMEQHESFCDWLDKNNFYVDFVDAHAIEGKVGTCVVLRTTDQVEVSSS